MATLAGVRVLVTLESEVFVESVQKALVARFLECGALLSILSSLSQSLAAQLQKEGAESFVKSWEEMMDVVARKAQACK